MNIIKKINIIGIISLGISYSVSVSAQSTTAGVGNTGAPGDYLGWAVSENRPLDIKHEDDQPIYFYTNAGATTFNNRKMSIWNRIINGVEHSGVGIQSTGTTNITLPRSILHLGNNYFTTGVAGWRPWIDVGTFCGKGSDFAYFGTMNFHGDTTNILGDHNDAVIVHLN